MSITDLSGLLPWRSVALGDAAEPQVTSVVDKDAHYTQRLQTVLDEYPVFERQWRTYRAYPYFDRAARLARSENIDGALAEYAKYLANDPDHIVMRWQQLLTLSQTDKLEETVSSASALLQRLPDFGPALLKRAITLRKLDRIEEAERDFLAARKDRDLVEEDHVFLLSELYAIALEREDYVTALAFLDAQQAFHPDPVEWHSARAVLLDRQGHLQDAQQAWKRVIALTTDPQKKQQATLSRARTLDKLEQYEAALALLEQAQRQGLFAPPGTPETQLDEFYRLRAEVAQRAGQIDTAIKAWEQIMALAPSPEARFKLANLWFLQGDAEKAFQLLQPLQDGPLPKEPDQAYTWYATLGNIAFKAGHLRPAYEAYQKALSIQDTPGARLKAVEAAWQLERYSDVVDLLQPLARSDNDSQFPSAVTWQQRLCSAYAKQAQLPRARTCFKTLADAYPNNVDVLTSLGNIAFQSRHLRTAFAAYQKALGLKDTPDTRLKAAEVAWQLERYSDVVDLLQPVARSAHGRRQKSALAWRQRLCSAYAKQAQYPTALACAEALADAYPNNVDVLTSLGNIAFASGHLDTAFEAYQKVLLRRDTADVRLKTAEVAWQLERYPDVVALLQPVVMRTNSRPSLSTDAWRLRLCSAYAKQAQYPTALTCIEPLVDARPNDPDVLIEAAHFASQAKQPQRQLDYLRQLYRLQPMPELALDIGYLLTRLNLDAEAGDWFRRAYRKDQSAVAGLTYAQFLLKYQERDTAIEILRDVVEHHEALSRTEQSTAYAALGYALGDAQDFSGAADVWRQAYDLSADPILKLRQIWALRKAGKMEQAQTALDTFTYDVLPAGQAADWYEEVGTIWHEMGAYERSLEARQKALELEPTAPHWVQLSDTLMALSRPTEADAALVEAIRLSPDTSAYLRRRAYLQIAMHRDRSAAALFEQVRAAGDSDLALDGELGYLYTRLADYDNAASAFKRAIDDEPRYLVTTPETHNDVQVQLAAMRSELQAMERRWALTLSNNTCLVESGCRIANTATDDGSAGQAFGAVEVAYQPPKIGFYNGRIFQLFSRLFWSYGLDALSFDLNEDSLQVGLGARYKPFARHNLFVSLEHLFKIGDDTEDNWLARLSWSHTRGAAWRPHPGGETMASEPYLSLYADIAKFLQHDQALVLTGTVRAGWTFKSGDQWQLSPFAYGVGQGTIDDQPITAHVEAGLGLAVRFRFNFNRYWGYRHYIEMFSRVGHDLHNSESDLELRALAGVGLNF